MRTREAQKMSVTRQEVEKARRIEAVKLLSWGRSLDYKVTTPERYYEERGWTYK